MPDPNNAADVLTFIKTDPFTVGLAAITAANPGSDAPILSAVNSQTGAGSGTQPATPISVSDLTDLIAPDDFKAMSTAMSLQYQNLTLGGTVNVGGSSAQQKINSLFTGYADTLANMSAAYTRPASPWERQFGSGQVADVTQIDNARRFTGTIGSTTYTGNNF